MKKTTANYEIKRINRSGIYRLFFEEEKLSKRDIVMRLGLSLPTVTQNLTDLLDEGLIAESGTRGNTGGRSAVAYSCVAAAHTAIGMDITKHHITAVALDLRGHIIGGIREKHTFERSDAYYRKLGRVVNQVIEQNEIAPQSVLGVGFGVPGLITEDNRGVFYGKILNFTGATVEEFSHYIPFPAKLFNDANAACFAETWLTEDVDNTFYIMLSNNVGGAVRINRLMYPGDNLHAGEVGHLTIHPEGKPCYCGQRGCVDAYCSAPVLFEGPEDTLEKFFARLDAGEQLALDRWEKYTDDLASTVKTVRTLFDSKIILGGYVGAYMDRYVEAFRSKVARLTPFDKNADYISVCKYKNESIAAGAALDFISEFVESV